MKHLVMTFALSAFIPAFSNPPFSHPLNLNFQGNGIHLGMTKREALASLSEVQAKGVGDTPLMESNEWLLLPKDGVLSLYGQIKFQHGKITYIEKDYDRLQDSDPISIGNTLNEVLTEWIKLYGNTFTIQTSAIVKADLVQRITLIKHLNHHLFITTTEGVISPVTSKIRKTTIYETLQ